MSIRDQLDRDLDRMTRGQKNESRRQMDGLKMERWLVLPVAPVACLLHGGCRNKSGPLNGEGRRSGGRSLSLRIDWPGPTGGGRPTSIARSGTAAPHRGLPSRRARRIGCPVGRDSIISTRQTWQHILHITVPPGSYWTDSGLLGLSAPAVSKTPVFWNEPGMQCHRPSASGLSLFSLFSLHPAMIC